MVIRVPDQRKTPGGYAALDDRLLVLDFQAGNPQAFVEIHRRYGALARHVCQRFLPNQPDADEAFQETMIRVFQGLYRFNGRYALQPWIARIAKNVSLDILRGRARRPQTDDSAPASDELPVPGDEADEIVERLVQRDTVLSVMADLPETHRRALMLREFEGRSHREVAQELEITTSQAKALIHRAKASFRRLWLEKVADRGGLMGFAFLPLLWLARLGNGLRRVADRVGAAAQVAQAAVPEAVTSTVTTTAAPAASGVSERLVAAGVTLLLAGGVTVGAARIVTSGGENDAVARASVTTAAPAPDVTTDRVQPPIDDPRLNATVREDEIKAEPPILIEPPSPTVAPSPEPEPSPSPTEEPPVDETTPPPPPPAPAWTGSLTVDWPSEDLCKCAAGMTLISSNTLGAVGPDSELGVDQSFGGAATDGEGDEAWALEGHLLASLAATEGEVSLSFTLARERIVSTYIVSASFVALPDALDDGPNTTTYRFVGEYSLAGASAGSPIPTEGRVVLDLGLWADGTTVHSVSIDLSRRS